MDLTSYLLGKKKGGGGTPPVLITKSITANGTYNASDDSADGYSKAVVDVTPNLQNKNVTITENTTTTIQKDTGYDGLGTVSVTTNVPTGTVEVPEKDVNFIDYDGTIVYSYTKSEFLQLTELPENPTHERLTSQGWNWTLSDAQTYVTNYGGLIIGQNYITDDGSTRLYVTLSDERKKPYMSLYLNGTLKIDWGDNTEETTLTGTAINTLLDTYHEYATGGDYVIKVKPQENTTFAFAGKEGGINKIFWAGSTTQTYNNFIYNKAITKIEFGSSFANFKSSTFDSFSNIESVTIPNNIPIYANNCFRYCLKLKAFVCPTRTINADYSYMFYMCAGLEKVATSKQTYYVSQYAFQYCYNLRNFYIGDYDTGGLYNYAFGDCQVLKKLILPSNINTLSNYALTNCYSLKEINLEDTKLSQINQYGLQGCQSLTKLKFSKYVTQIQASAFAYCGGMKLYDFTESTSIPTLSNSSAFNSMPSDCYIVVPDNLYDTWITTGNWVNVASQIISETDYNNL